MMKRNGHAWYLALSIALHIAMGLCVVVTPRQQAQPELLDKVTIDVIANGNRASFASKPQTPAGQPKKSTQRRQIDLRPSFAKYSTLFSGRKHKTSRDGTGDDRSRQNAISNSDARELLLTETKVLVAFDLLAEKINYYIDYPIILIENGVQGIATLDLYFDQEGNIDADQSRFFGDNRYVRGILVRAARKGVVKWYLSDAVRLQKDQFKNQHFRAEFAISYTLPSISRIEKNSLGSYTFLRRHYMHECANPTGIDVACLAAKAYGALQSEFSDSYKIKFRALKDTLEHYDDIGLNGIGALIRGA